MVELNPPPAAGPAPRASVALHDELTDDPVSRDHMAKAGPGWYFDPADEAVYRYWDGERWTNRLSDTVTAEIRRN